MARNTERTVNTLIERYFLLFPDEAAKTLEGLTAKEVVGLLEAQSVNASSRVLQRLTPDLASEALGLLEDDAFQSLARTLESVRFASLISRLEPERQDARLGLLEAPEAKEIRELMSYDADTAGSVMDPRVTVFRFDVTVREALGRLRQLKGRPIADVFIVDGD